MKNTKQIGSITELQCMLAFIKQGFTISIPYGDNAKYDFIADIKGKLIRIQVKTAQPISQNNETVGLIIASRYKGNQHYSPEDIDYVATYWNDTCYLIKVTTDTYCKNLRFTPPKNGQVTGIHYAEEFELSKVLQYLL